MKRLLILIACFFMLILFALFLLSYLYVTNYDWSRDSWNQEKIAAAYIAYFRDKRQFPDSLEVLVNAGYLPREADFYREPPGWYWHGRPIVSYQQGSYLVFAPKEGKVECLCMIARKAYIDDKEVIKFNFPINADVRDEIDFLQRHPSWGVTR